MFYKRCIFENAAYDQALAKEQAQAEVNAHSREQWQRAKATRRHWSLFLFEAVLKDGRVPRLQNAFLKLL